MIDFPKQRHDHLLFFTASLHRNLTILDSFLTRWINFAILPILKKEQGTKEAKLCCCPYVSIEVLTVVAVNVLECIELRRLKKYCIRGQRTCAISSVPLCFTVYRQNPPSKPIWREIGLTDEHCHQCKKIIKLSS